MVRSVVGAAFSAMTKSVCAFVFVSVCVCELTPPNDIHTGVRPFVLDPAGGGGGARQTHRRRLWLPATEATGLAEATSGHPCLVFCFKPPGTDPACARVALPLIGGLTRVLYSSQL